MKKKRRGWPRRAKVTRNLLLALLFALTAWSQLGKPLPHNADVRRLERQYLIPKTEYSVKVPDSDFVDIDVQINWTEGAAIASRSAQGGLNRMIPKVVAMPVRLRGGTELFPSPYWRVRIVGVEWEFSAVYAAVFPPEDSVTAVLTLHNNTGKFTASSQREDDIFLFYVVIPEKAGGSLRVDSSWFDADLFHYELVFFDENGNLIQEITG